MTGLYIGLMSGTSMDSIDAALLDLSAGRVQLVATHTHAYSNMLLRQLEQALELEDPLGDDLTALDTAVGEAFAAAANALLDNAGLAATAITAIGSHGQTIRHEPAAPAPYSLQLGAPETIAALTGIDVVADFRRADIEAGGQGAPLVPAFHRAIFASPSEDRVILNIGGIANITRLPADSSGDVTGFDTGPGNTLMDAWIVANAAPPSTGMAAGRRKARLTSSCSRYCCATPTSGHNHRRAPGENISTWTGCCIT